MVLKRTSLLPLLLAGLFGSTAGWATAEAANATTDREPNRLIHEKSPYLRQHAYNPVDWYPWGDEAFAKARAENKPIFLSIGYSTCHWCHVMADESFADEATAAIINEHFVAIKVDREERPDVDHIYMTFVQASTGSGGWPLNVWLTPERQPFFGGVYFAPEDRGRRPGFPRVLNHLAGLWAEDPARIREQSTQMLDALTQEMVPAPDPDEVDWNALRDAGLSGFTERFDPGYGGFDTIEKFPSGPTLEFLIDVAASHPEPERRQHALDMLTTTLEAIVTQGLHDHVGGGYHRYTVDTGWQTPHFEKMLFDQALITNALLSAWQLTGNDEFRIAAIQTLRYVEERLTHPEGGFYSAEDAVSLPTAEDTTKREGAYYTWTAEELQQALSPENYEFFAAAFGIQANGNVTDEQNPQGELDHQNVLRQALTPAQLAERFELTETEARDRLMKIPAGLRSTRNERPAPHLDDKIVTAWNGMMISAYARAAQILDEPAYLSSAQRAARFLRDRLYDAETQSLSRTYRDGRRNAWGFAEDYALVIQGLLDLYEADFDIQWLQWAMELQQRQTEIFRDETDGGFFASDPRDESIVLRLKVDHDGAEPAATSITVRNLGRLAALLHDEDLLEHARAAARSLATAAERSPAALPQLLASVAWIDGDAQQALVHATARDPNLSSLLEEIRGRYHPRRMVVRIDEASRPYFESHVPFIAGLPDEWPDAATAYICENFVCQMPTSDRQELAEILNRQTR